MWTNHFCVEPLNLGSPTAIDFFTASGMYSQGIDRQDVDEARLAWTPSSLSCCINEMTFSDGEKPKRGRSRSLDERKGALTQCVPTPLRFLNGAPKAGELKGSSH